MIMETRLERKKPESGCACIFFNVTRKENPRIITILRFLSISSIFFFSFRAHPHRDIKLEY